MPLKKNNPYKLIILVLLPIVIGVLIEALFTVGNSGENQLLLFLGKFTMAFWTYGYGVIFWISVGRVFGRLKMPVAKRFILGNIVWGISISLYIWQYKLLGDVNRNNFIAGISELYPLAFMHFTSSRVLFSHFLMLIVFVIGFVSTLRQQQ